MTFLGLKFGRTLGALLLFPPSPVKAYVFLKMIGLTFCFSWLEIQGNKRKKPTQTGWCSTTPRLIAHFCSSLRRSPAKHKHVLESSDENHPKVLKWWVLVVITDLNKHILHFSLFFKRKVMNQISYPFKASPSQAKIKNPCNSKTLVTKITFHQVMIYFFSRGETSGKSLVLIGFEHHLYQTSLSFLENKNNTIITNKLPSAGN